MSPIDAKTIGITEPADTPERICRAREARHHFAVGKTKFHEDIAPRLDRIQLGTRSVGYTLSSIRRVIAELLAETATAPKFVPVPNRPKPSPKSAPESTASKQKKRHRAEAGLSP